MKVSGMSGSLSEPSRTAAVIRAVQEYAAALPSVESWVHGPASRPHEGCDGRVADAYDRERQDAIRAVLTADALVVGMPVYRGAYTAALKELSGLVAREPIAGKGTGLAALGGSPYPARPAVSLRPMADRSGHCLRDTLRLYGGC